MPNHNPTPSLEVIDRYIAGDATPAENRVVTEWLHLHPDEKRRLSIIRDLANRRRSQHKGQNTDLGARTAEIVAYSVQRRSKAVPPNRESGVHDRFRTGLSLSGMTGNQRFGVSVAVICILFTCAILAWDQMFPVKRDAGVSIYSTRSGERATVTLPDSSVVELNVASQLRVPTDFNDSNREVQLTGEAMFTIKHASKLPFVVVSGKTRTKVLGTVFTVRHYESDTAVTVAVQEGKVAVGAHILTAQQQIAIGISGNGQITKASSTRSKLVFDMLVLDSVPLSTGIIDLNRWYDADIRLGDSTLEARRIVGGFTSGSLTDLIVILQRTFNLRVVRDGRRLTLYPGT